MPTQNKRGFTYELSHIGEAFIQYCGVAAKPVLDVGCAYGVATIPALEQGAEVIALDINEAHINQLKNNLPASLSKKLQIITAQFPYVNFEESSLSAVYISQVLPFLTKEEITLTAELIHRWLMPDGKLFLVSFTPYLRHCSSYIPVYEAKRRQGLPWAGYIRNLSDYSSNNPVAANLPESIYHADIEDMNRVFGKLFQIEYLDYFGDESNSLPSWIKYDDRERVGLIASKI